MNNVEQLDAHRPMQPMYSLMVYRKPDGSVFGSVNWADSAWVEANGLSVSDRMRIVAGHMPAVTEALIEQAEDFKTEEGCGSTAQSPDPCRVDDE